jgi:hypothetical protein
MEKDHQPTVQEVLAGLKEEQQQIAQQLKNHPEIGDQEGFAVLFEKNVEVSARIRAIEKSIVPAGPSRMVGDYSFRASRGPEGRRTTPKKH